MSDRREYERLHEVFAAVAECPAGERDAELDRLCGDDAALRQQVEALLSYHDQDDGALAHPLVASATERSGAATMESTVAYRLTEKPGDRIGPYRLLQEIGEGGFGFVYMAEQREPVRRKVALKIIKPGMDTKQVIARFEVERQALAMMDHPNIARVLDAGATESGRPYFVMELVKGDPVTEYCDRQNLTTKERLEIFRQICLAVQHAHQKGVIHRDLKPSNVLVTLADGKPIPKVIDFGIAKATNRELTDRTLFTELRQLIGTPEYMSPEQAEMTGVDIDTRSDIYSLGVLLYELLTGTTPFDPGKLRSAAYGEIQRIIREEEPPKPSTRLHSLMTPGHATTDDDEHSSIQYIAHHRRAEPMSLSRLMRGDLDWIVMKCLEKDRTRRYETANGLANDIQRYLDDEPVSAGPPTAMYRMRKFVRRNRVGVAMAATVAAALVLGVIGTSWGLAEATHERDRALDAETRATRELTRANEVKRIITEMLSSIKPEKARGADITLLRGILDDTAQRLANGEVADERIAAELQWIIGTTYSALGLYEEAEDQLTSSVNIRRRVLGAEHLDTLRSMNSLAIVYNGQGRHAEAESLHLETLEILRRVLGEEHPNTLKSTGNLAAVYQEQGRYAESESLKLKKLEILRRVLGEEHPDTLTSMHNLAITYLAQGRYVEAESLSQETLEIMRRVLGEEHPVTLQSMTNLAHVHKTLGRYTEAESLSLQVFEIKRRVLGEEHPDTLSAMMDIAIVYQKQGRYDEAESLLLETLEIQRRVLGAEHPSTLASMNNLANVYIGQGRYDQAESLHLETVEILRRELGAEHPSTIESMGNLASLYQEQRRHAEAESLFLETLEAKRGVFGDEHESTLGTMTNLVLVYKWQGRYAEAERLGLKVVETGRRVLGREHHVTLNALKNLGILYNEMGRYEKARAVLETSLPIMQRVMGMRHGLTQRAIWDLSEAYAGLGLQRERMELYLTLAEHPDASVETLNNAAWELLTHEVEALRDPPRTLALAREACDLADPAPAHILDTLALALFETGDVAGAVETARLALERVPDDASDRQEYIDQLRKWEDTLEEGTTGGADG